MRWLSMALCVLLVALGMSLSVPFVALAKDSEMRASNSQYSTAGGTVSHQRDSEQRDSAADSQYAATEGASAADSQYADNSAPQPSGVLPADSRAGGTDLGRSASTAPEPPAELPEATAPEPPPQPSRALPANSRAGGTGLGRSASQGSVAVGPVVPQEDFPAYSQVVDNSSPGRFVAPGWDTDTSNLGDHGEDYRVARPSERGESARFKVKIPATDVYSVYAWWPAEEANNAAVRFAVRATSGVERTKVDQRKDGGLWVKIGEYEMESGDRYAVRISPASRKEGRVVADAVAVVRGLLSDPPDEGYEGTTSSGPTRTPSITQSQGERLVSLARSHIGTRYVHSPPSLCEAHRSEDCSCLTMLVFSEAEMPLADDPIMQWSEGRRIAESDLRPGDLVFFKERGHDMPITHVGIYSGNGNLVHASKYFGRVVESKMSHMRGYYGAKRL